MPHPEPADQCSSSLTPGPTIPHPTAQPARGPGLAQRPQTRSSPVPVEKQASSVGAVCGNDNSFTNKTDNSFTDGINLEHKQEQRQSAKDAGSTRRCGHQTSWYSRSNASQYERSGSTSPRQSTPDIRVRTTYQTDATSTGDTTDPGRS